MLLQSISGFICEATPAQLLHWELLGKPRVGSFMWGEKVRVFWSLSTGRTLYR